MGVEAGGNDDQLGLNSRAAAKSGSRTRCGTCAAVAGAQRRIDDGVVFAALADGAGAGKERHLVRRTIHHRLVGPENILRAVAVMDVEIDDGGAGDAVAALGIARGNSGVVEKAETHRPCRSRRGGRAVWRRRTHCRRFLVKTSSTASMAPPAARSAASKVPGDIEVSASR